MDDRGSRHKRLSLPRPLGDSVDRALCVCGTLGSVDLGSADRFSRQCSVSITDFVGHHGKVKNKK